MADPATIWKKCTECRTDIAFGTKYYQCSVSTCNRARMPLVFCSVTCWDSHLSSVRHRDAGAIEARAPSKEQWAREQAEESRSDHRIDKPAPAVAVRAGTPTSAGVPVAVAAPPPRSGPAPTSDSVQPSRVRADETRPHLAPPPPASSAGGEGGVRRVVGVPAPAPSDGPHLNDIVDREILIVVSKLKKYIKDRSGMNCSDAVAEVLSEHVRALCDDSIRAAARDERKTVLDRDVPRPRFLGR